jgi:hypothetical protein
MAKKFDSGAGMVAAVAVDAVVDPGRELRLPGSADA